MYQQYEKREKRSVMKCDRNVMMMTLHQHSFYDFSLDNCVDDTPTEIGLNVDVQIVLLSRIKLTKRLDFAFFFLSFDNYLFFHGLLPRHGIYQNIYVHILMSMNNTILILLVIQLKAGQRMRSRFTTRCVNSEISFMLIYSRKTHTIFLFTLLLSQILSLS